jgi:hypothetical protein
MVNVEWREEGVSQNEYLYTAYAHYRDLKFLDEIAKTL